MKKLLVIIAFLVLCPSLVAADAVEEYASGIFEGSMRYIANFADANPEAVNGEVPKGVTAAPGTIVITKVKGGDFVSVRFAGKEYAFGKGEPNGFYVKRLIRGEKRLTYDFGSERSKTLNVTDTIELDFSKDGVVDVTLTWIAVDGDSATFSVALLESGATEETNGTAEENVTQEPEPAAETIEEPTEEQETVVEATPGGQEQETGPTENNEIPLKENVEKSEPGFFARIFNWFRSLFSSKEPIVE